MNMAFSAALAVHLAGSIRAARRNYRKRLKRCQKKFSETAVHDLRVETRRLLAMVDLLQTLSFEDSLKKTRKILKERLDMFAELRDTQVQLRLLKPLWREFPEARDLKKKLRQHERQIVSRVRHKIKTAKYTRVVRRLKALEKHLGKSVAAKSPRTSSGVISSALRQAFARVAALRQQVGRNDSAAIHRMRVAFKRFRYLSELLQPFLPQMTAERLRRMQKYQAMAGEIQDLEILLARLKQLIGDKEIQPATIMKLRSNLLQHRRRALVLFMERIDDLFKFQPDDGVGRKQTQPRIFSA
jgi:CHAD domain-containing protein